ncbi:MAG: hypothetical protein H0X35_12505 [Pseudonocardiales bacterium]|nr:hypothetical protein [Pseudonocardiales bacterium]
MLIRRSVLSIVAALAMLMPATTATAAGPASAAAAAKPMATRVFHGTGDSVVRMGIGRHSVLVIVTASSPQGLLVQPLSKGDVEGAYQVYESHAYSGTTALISTPYSLAVTGFSIRTAGPWTIKIKPISAAPLWRKGTKTGHGDMVFRVYPAITKLTPARLVFSGAEIGNFIVTPYVRGVSRGSLVNFLGTHTNKRVLLPVGTDLVSVVADGAWRLSR